MNMYIVHYQHPGWLKCHELVMLAGTYFSGIPPTDGVHVYPVGDVPLSLFTS